MIFFKYSAMYKENIPTISCQQGPNKPRDWNAKGDVGRGL